MLVERAAQPGEPPLFVDLDGTLVRTDTLVESVLALLRRRPLMLFVLPFWLLRGKALLKEEIARRVELSVEDDGRGFDPLRVPPTHMGLRIMEERAQATGALLRIDSEAGRGTRISVEWQATPGSAD